MLSLLCCVRCENMRGRMYWPAASERTDLDTLVRRGLVLEVSATPTSLRGYVAVPVDDFAALIDAMQDF
jgi:hypothetical protein